MFLQLLLTCSLQREEEDFHIHTRRRKHLQSNLKDDWFRDIIIALTMEAVTTSETVGHLQPDCTVQYPISQQSSHSSSLKPEYHQARLLMMDSEGCEKKWSRRTLRYSPGEVRRLL
jgi:hypothetical protein